MKKIGFVFFAAFAAAVALAEPVKVIFDTDMYTDFDDVGAMAVLHALADAGECEILGTVVSTRGAPSAGMVEILNAYYGRADLPVGGPQGMGIGPGHDHLESHLERQKSYKMYMDMIAANPAVKHPLGAAVPDANEVYRKLLAAAPDRSVTIISVGFTTNLRRLLETKADALSPLAGKALVAKKVKVWYAMATRYPEGREYNSMADAESSRLAFIDWPSPVYFLDFNYGVTVRCGVSAAKLADGRNPVRDVFKRALTEYGEIDKGHPSWDEVTVLAAVRGWEKYFGVARGRMAIVDEKGTNRWQDDPDGNHYVLTEKTPKAEVGKIIDELICREPKRASAK